MSISILNRKESLTFAASSLEQIQKEIVSRWNVPDSANLTINATIFIDEIGPFTFEFLDEMLPTSRQPEVQLLIRPKSQLGYLEMQQVYVDINNRAKVIFHRIKFTSTVKIDSHHGKDVHVYGMSRIFISFICPRSIC
jgi:hypothetical protein